MSDLNMPKPAEEVKKVMIPTSLLANVDTTHKCHLLPLLTRIKNQKSAGCKATDADSIERLAV